MDKKIWDNLAVDYDKSVEDNQNPLIVTYLKKEIDILSTICKKIWDLDNHCSIIDMGSGTGRVVFALDEKLKKKTVQFCGVEISNQMLNHANKKNHDHKSFSKINFLKSDLTNPNLFEYFNLDETNIVICSYNTFNNGDNFSFVAPKLYNSMIPMIRQIDDDSFDESNRLFQNSLGFHSQWFTKNEVKDNTSTENLGNLL